ncbi:hypothetical protein L593_08305 [Salinarchaeum sp. Harcht-Bsk1]|uniref:GIDE domain-containing protein n=1 Tax=Salinarchaeum sp. Harcht-Bsk1 TaxID=1333523 RepID=UPI0003423E81|nr:GIDE domain-containing protein [Salinarchaeum sp. Harcht-Bsk1]AGN01606.1 hypothetical protein L593_08305 [Salinarchaeum sp. Harcht-Bsk1]
MALDVGGIVSLLLLALLVLGPAAWVIHHYAVLQDFRTARTVFRLDATSLAVGGVLLAGSVALVVIAFEPAAPLAMIFGGTLLVFGIAGVTIAVANLDWYLASRRLPVDSPASVEPGPVQLEGRAVPLGEFVPSAVTQTDSLAYRGSTREEYAVLGRGYASSTWSAVSVAEGATRFGVVDPAAIEGVGDDEAATNGRELPAKFRAELDDPDVELPADVRPIAVDADAAEFPLLFPTSRLVELSPAGATLDGLERTIPAEPGTTVPVADELARGTRSRPREYSERRLDAGDPVYVLGTARETADGEIEIGPDPDGPPFVVTRLTAEAATAHARRFCRTYGLLGLASLAAGAGLIASVGL